MKLSPVCPELPLAQAIDYDLPPAIKGLSRRQVLGAISIGVVGCLGSVVDSDKRLGALTDSAAPTTFEDTGASVHGHGGDRYVTVVFPGFNAKPGRLTGLLAPEFRKYGDVTTINYGTDMYPATLARRLNDMFSSEYIVSDPSLRPRLIIYGHSMGGIVGLVTAALLAQNYGYSVPLCVLDNTPSKTQDVRGNSKQLLLAFLASAGRYGMHGGPLTRFLSVAGSHLSDGESLEESLRYARDEAIPSDPYNYNRTNQIQAEVIETAPHNLRWGSAQLQETLLAYMLPKIPESDRTVDGQSAYASLQKDFPDIRQIRIPGGEHGVNHATREQYYQEIAQLAAAAGILPISQRTHKHSELPSTVSALPRSL